jgi:hypothetical protein
MAAAPTRLNLVMIFFLRVSIDGENREFALFSALKLRGVTTEVSKDADEPTKLGFKKLN